jgi:phosphatidylglycerophosphate synthase
MLDIFLRRIKDQIFFLFAKELAWIHPNIITLFAFLAGVLSTYSILKHSGNFALVCWFLNRILDGLDGTVARITNRQSDFGGYFDIVTDFIIYTSIPVYKTSRKCFKVFLVISYHPLQIALVYSAPSEEKYFALALLLGSYFVNAASLMYLAAILEKRASGAKQRGEMTSVTMPVALIEGTETIIFFSLFLLFPQHIVSLYYTMAILVGVNIIQRLWWAWKNL